MRRALLLACVILVVPGAFGAAARAAEPHVFEGAITLAPPEGVLQDACGLALDSVGRVFVSSYYVHAVYVFSPPNFEGKRKLEATVNLKEPPLAPSGKSVGGPCDLALDGDGNLYVNNWHYDVVRLPRLPGNPPSFGPGVVIDSNQPTGVAFDSASEHILVDDRTSVAVYDPAGAPVPNGGEPLRIGLGSLDDGYGVAVSRFAGKPGFPATAGRVYVADAADGTIKVYDPSGNPAVPVQVIDGGGTPGLGFTRLVDSDLAVDPADGHVYVVDNLEPFFEEPEAVAYEFSSLGHYRGTVPGNVGSGHGSQVVHGEPSGVAIFEHDVYLTSGNYFDDGTQPRHAQSQVRIYSPAANVETRILTATKTGAGSGTVFSSSPAGLGCGSACVGEFTFGATVVLNAVPAPHSRFAGWTECPKVLAGQPPQCEVGMGADREVFAEFEPIGQHQLTVAMAGSGTGTVTSAPAAIDCGAVCGGEFDEGSTVTLAATAGQHSAFAGWSGCDSEPAAGRCAVAMGADRGVTAHFEAIAEPPPAQPPAPRPSSESLVGGILGPGPAGPLRIRGLTVHGGSARLQVAVPSAGTLSVTGPGLRPVSALPFAAGNVTVLLSLDAAGRRSLDRAARHQLRVKVGLSFSPLDGGAPARAARSVTFRGGGAR